jgi:hypothetical protein
MKTKNQDSTHAVAKMRDAATIQTTSGYVPIVGIPGDPEFPAPGDNSSTTTYTVSAIEGSAPAAAMGKKEKTKGYSVKADAVKQQYLDEATGQWTTIAGPSGLPFSLNVTAGGTESVSKDEQFLVEVTNQPNHTTSKTRVVVEYTVTVGAVTKSFKVTVVRPKF